MLRILAPALMTALLLATRGAAALAVTRGDLIYDGIPDTDSGDVLDSYLSARQATPPLETVPDRRLLRVFRHHR